ncbi:hypothetical protein [Chondromyces apiculatus]|uniref:Uncharacterized protein n=1 Tax=Chondromyces apiculatus DSM 436 TaxID=1192034 RepID=A0A017T8Z0_9BACT|nr:hypothetical protein [Chondromyces apiculatus]EYF05738.1 Hypothetical protein CAP_3028 [Chondromyces apiculatus DSM 436]
MVKQFRATTPDYYARWSYEQLIQLQPHIHFEGLWALAGKYFVVCPEVHEARASDGEALSPWFEQHCRVLGASVEIVEAPPAGSERVAERSSADRALLRGSPRTVGQLFTELAVSLPRNFPEFFLENAGGLITVVTSSTLSDDQCMRFLSECDRLGDDVPIKFEVRSAQHASVDPFRVSVRRVGINLIPCRHLPSNLGRDLRFAIEEDEDFWTANREKILGSYTVDRADVLGTRWSSRDTLACVVDALGRQRHNIRSHLSLYERVYLVMPLAEHFDTACSGLAVTQDELLELVALDRVRLLLPQSVDRYPLTWLSKVAEKSPLALLPSRRLLAGVIADSRCRIPLVYPPLSPRDRYLTLNALARAAHSTSDEGVKSLMLRMTQELGNSWSSVDASLHYGGAMGSASCGIGWLTAAAYEHVSGKDLRIEMSTAGMKVEWAAALGAHLFPIVGEGYDETAACDLVAGLYGPAASGSVVPPAALSTIDDILALDSRVPVVAFAKEFSTTNVNRLRELVLRLTRENIDPEFLSAAIEKFNADVRHYERRPDLLKTVNIVGHLSAAVTATQLVDPGVMRFLPILWTALAFLLARLIDEVPDKNGAAGAVIDYLNGVLASKPNSEVVLVARAKKHVKILRR